MDDHVFREEFYSDCIALTVEGSLIGIIGVCRYFVKNAYHVLYQSRVTCRIFPNCRRQLIYGLTFFGQRPNTKFVIFSRKNLKLVQESPYSSSYQLQLLYYPSSGITAMCLMLKILKYNKIRHIHQYLHFNNTTDERYYSTTQLSPSFPLCFLLPFSFSLLRSAVM